MNNKGFTLIELLATISLLAVLMIIAVPNVIGVVQRNKNKTYIEDAKKLVSLAEYKIRSNSSNKPTGSSSYCFTMDSLGAGNFDSTAPNGGKYRTDKSYVRVYKSGTSEMQYMVVLVEEKENNGGFVGVGVTKEINSTELYNDDISSYISSAQTVNQIKTCSGEAK